MATRQKTLPAGPETVGSVSAVELTELRARSRTIGEISALRDLYQRMLAIATNELINYRRELLTKHGIEGPEEFSINEESGAILKFPEE